MRIQGEAVLAKCAFGRGNRHQAYLTPDALLIKLKHLEFQRFERDTIKNIHIRHRILWLPLVLGGILAPFAVIALIKTTGAFWLLFLLALVGLFLMYYGYSGSDSFTITTSVKDYDYFIDRDKPHLKAFIQFVRGQLIRSDTNLYIGTSREQYQDWLRSGMVPSGTEVFFQRSDMPPVDVVLYLNPQEQETPLEFNAMDELSKAKSYLRNDTPVNTFQEFPGAD